MIRLTALQGQIACRPLSSLNIKRIVLHRIVGWVVRVYDVRTDQAIRR
jgi:hypothetical protein